jgi:hypothetical protein
MFILTLSAVYRTNKINILTTFLTLSSYSMIVFFFFLFCDSILIILMFFILGASTTNNNNQRRISTVVGGRILATQSQGHRVSGAGPGWGQRVFEAGLGPGHGVLSRGPISEEASRGQGGWVQDLVGSAWMVRWQFCAGWVDVGVVGSTVVAGYLEWDWKSGHVGDLLCSSCFLLFLFLSFFVV